MMLILGRLNIKLDDYQKANSCLIRAMLDNSHKDMQGCCLLLAGFICLFNFMKSIFLSSIKMNMLCYHFFFIRRLPKR